MPTPPPSTFRAWLQSELARRCAHNERYSLRAFARQLAVDPATLSQLLRGRRALTPDTVDHLGRAAGLDPETVARFAREVERPSDATSLHGGAAKVAAEIVAEPLHHELLALMTTAEFRPDVRWIARVLDTTVDAVQLVVQRLVHFGLLSLASPVAWRDVTGAGHLPSEAFEERVWRQALDTIAGTAATKATPPTDDLESHPVGAFQILCGDPRAAARFFGAVFGWVATDDNAFGALQVSTGGQGPAGGFWPAPPGVPAFVQILVSVGDVPAAVDRASAHGATVVVPPVVLPDGDAMAVLRDPQGVPFGVFHSEVGRHS